MTIVRQIECKIASSASGLPGLDRAINPYRGCSHACAYCYAQDVTRFEMSRPWGEVIEVKKNIVSRLRFELAKQAKGVYGLGTVTDPYQPLEKEYCLARGCLELLKRHEASISILSKSDLVLRDLDLLSGWDGAEVGVSIGTVDSDLAAWLEPGAPSPCKRFEALRTLSSAGICTYLMAAPIIPGISDSEDSLQELVARAHESHVRRIMWDKYNPKPVASSRLRRALDAHGFELKPFSMEQLNNTRSVLARECRRHGIELDDAF